MRPSGRPGGFGGPDASGAPGTRPGGSGDGQATAYRTCLSNRGLDPDHPDSGDPKTKEALTACAVLSPSPDPLRDGGWRPANVQLGRIARPARCGRLIRRATGPVRMRRRPTER
ncbi:hypothetical protein GCM10027614_05740 [Micromonospora vulcania]